MRNDDQLKAASSLIRDRVAGIAVLTALLLPLFVLVLGGAVDVSSTYIRRIDAQSAADAAVLAGANHAKLMIGNEERETIISNVEQTVRGYFTANASYGQSLSLVDVQFQGEVVDISVDYQDNAAMSFLPVMGIDQMTYTGGAGGKYGVPFKLDVIFLVDGSGSMGMGANQTEQDRLINLTGCTFACHSQPNPNYDLVRSAGISTKIDIGRQAMLSAIDSMNLPQDGLDIRFGVYLFTNYLVPIFDVTDPLSNDHAWVKQQIEQNVGLVPDWGGGTNLHYSLDQLEQRLAAQAASENDSNRKKMVVIFTDGMEDAKETTTSGAGPDANYIKNTPHYEDYWTFTQNVNPQICAPLKSMGYEIAIVWTKYVIPKEEHWSHQDNQFRFIRDVLLPQTQGKLQTCSSGGTYLWSADTPADIVDSLQELLSIASTPLHLAR